MFEPYQAPSRRAEYEAWDNTDHTTMMWQLIDRNDLGKQQKEETGRLRKREGRGKETGKRTEGRTEGGERLRIRGHQVFLSSGKWIARRRL